MQCQLSLIPCYVMLNFYSALQSILFTIFNIILLAEANLISLLCEEVNFLTNQLPGKHINPTAPLSTVA